VAPATFLCVISLADGLQWLKFYIASMGGTAYNIPVGWRSSMVEMRRSIEILESGD